jgi:TPR repeat protein
VPLDYVSAYRWYSLVAEGGDAGSKTRMKSLSRLMTKQQIDAAATIPVSPSRRLGEVDSDDQTFRTSFAASH